VIPARISLLPGRLRKFFKTCGRKAFVVIRRSSGGKSCFVRGDQGYEKTSFLSLIFILFGFWVHPQGSGRVGVGERGSRFCASGYFSDDSCASRDDNFKTIGSACLASLPIFVMFLVSKTHVQDALAKKGLNRPVL
jgi:hypothetical protein